MANFFSGLAKGLADGQKLSLAKEQQELNNKLAKLQGQLLETQVKQAQMKQDTLNELSAPTTKGVSPQTFIDQLEGQLQSGTIEQIGKPATGGDVLSRLADLSFPQLNAIGVKPTDIANLQRQTQFNTMIQNAISGNEGGFGFGGQSGGITQGQGGQTPGGIRLQGFDVGSDGNIKLDFDRNKLHFEEVTLKDGRTVLQPIDPFTGRPMGGGNLQTSPALGELPAESKELENFIDKETLGVPQGNLTLNQVRGSDKYVRVTSKQREKIDASKSAITTYNEINNLVSNIFEGVNNALGERTGKGTELFINQFTQENPDAIVYQNLNSELVTLIRAMGDVGAISDTQVTEAESLIPKLLPVPDSTAVAKQKMDKLHNIITAPISTVLGKDAVPKPEKSLSDLKNLSNEELIDQAIQELQKQRDRLSGTN